MFNDLGQNNGVNKQASSVDDIFADTDKTPEIKQNMGYYPTSGLSSQTEIETQKVGLATSDAGLAPKSKVIKIILLVVLTIMVIGLAVLIYFKFLASSNTETETPVIDSPILNPVTSSSSSEIDSNNGITPIESEVIIVDEPLSTTTGELLSTTTNQLIDSDSDGLTDDEEVILGTNQNMKDTDGDGLSDYEEIKTYNTNPMEIDSDSDGLSDYEEIIIYKTNPNKADSDDDGYSDGQEVGAGYNPLGDGKLGGLES